MHAVGGPGRESATDSKPVLDSVAPLPVRLDLGAAVRAASQAIAGDALPGHEVLVFSDLQASALSGGAAPEARVMFWDPPSTVENRGVDSARAEPAGWRPAGPVPVSGGRPRGASAGGRPGGCGPAGV